MPRAISSVRRQGGRVRVAANRNARLASMRAPAAVTVGFYARHGKRAFDMPLGSLLLLAALPLMLDGD